MDLSKLQTASGPRWAVDQQILPENFHLGQLMALPRAQQAGYLESLRTGQPAGGQALAPIDPDQEVWAAGVTYLRSRQAREAESATGDIYQRVYTAERPELFFKASGWRVVGPQASIRIRRDSRWNVPEPELTLLLNQHAEICGYTAGNDVSSRDIEGENPLYLPQAKVYNGSCALGPHLHLLDDPAALEALAIRLDISRAGQLVFQGQTSTSQMKRSFRELAACLFAELDFPHGAFLMTGTGVVPGEDFTLQAQDAVQVLVGDLCLVNPVSA